MTQRAQAANAVTSPLPHRYPTTRLMHRSVRKIKEMNAGATSRALPMGNRFPLKAWQREGGNKQTKKNTPLLCGYFRRVLMSPVGEWVKSPFFPFLTTHPSLALWVIIEKKNLYSYSLFHPDSIYSSDNNISYSEKVFQVYFSFLFLISRRQPFSTIQKR